MTARGLTVILQWEMINLTDTEQIPVTAEKPKHVFRQTMRLVIKNFFDHKVGKNAAALAYYLLFAIFPLLIFVSNLLGLLDLNVTSITRYLQAFLPRDVVQILGNYLDYVSQTSSSALLWFSLVFSIYFPMRAAGGLMDDVRVAYQLGKPKNPILYGIRQLAYTLVLLIVILLTLLLSTVGRRMLETFVTLFPALENLPMMDMLLTLWQYLRFLLAAALMFAALGLLYASAQDRKQKVRTTMPGVAAALTGWLAVSIAFSFYVENFANYSIIYGTLGAVMVLLMWLYMTAVILILGAELNAALRTVRSQYLPE